MKQIKGEIEKTESQLNQIYFNQTPTKDNNSNYGKNNAQKLSIERKQNQKLQQPFDNL